MPEGRLYDSLTAGKFCKRFQIAGKQLVPFSLLHSVQLETIESPLWATGATEEATQADLWIAALVCSSSEPVIEFPKPDEDFDFGQACLVWRAYIDQCCAWPMLHSRPANVLGSDLSAPWELFVVTYLMRELGISEERAWTMPYGLAMWYYASAREQESGDSLILTEEKEKELDELNSDEAKAERARHDAAAKEISEATTAESGANYTERKAKSDLRVKLLGMLGRGELPDNWREQWLTT